MGSPPRWEASLTSEKKATPRHRPDGAKPKVRRGTAGKRKKKRAGPTIRRAPIWQVTPDDLGCLDDVRALLSALNDAYISSGQIQELVMNIPVLAARCIRRIGSEDFKSRTVLDRALTKIGNMGVEGELLGLLEDLTTCQADMQEAAAARSSPPGPG